MSAINSKIKQLAMDAKRNKRCLYATEETKEKLSALTKMAEKNPIESPAKKDEVKTLEPENKPLQKKEDPPVKKQSQIPDTKPMAKADTPPPETTTVTSAPKEPKLTPKPQQNSSLIKNIPLEKPKHTPSSVDDLKDVRSLLQKIAPRLSFNQASPSDEKAKKIKSAYKQNSSSTKEAFVFVNSDMPQSIAFLTNLSKAIDLYLFPCSTLDIKTFKSPDDINELLDSKSLKFVIACDLLIFSSKPLLEFLKEVPQKQTRFLKNTPLVMLTDVSLYEKDPSLKRSLWNHLCQMKKTLS